jgi:Fur family ferric uptake transcriptional regulator
VTRAHHSPPLEFRTLDDVVDAVRAGGGRLSVPRRMILEALFAAQNPVSAEQVSREQRLELTSVYRNLENLEQLGVVSHVHLGHGPGLYALAGRGRREYLVCEHCDAVTAVLPPALDGVRALIRETFGFQAAFGHFPIIGVCADCARHVHQGGPMSPDPHAHEHTHADGTTHTHTHVEHDHDHTDHEHTHTHADGTTHSHEHVHEDGLEHDHTHDH